jgi:HK97 family phage major capsid protein
MTLEQLRARLEAIQAERRDIHTATGDGDMSAEQVARWEALDTEEPTVRAQIDTEERAERVRESRARWGSTQVRTTGDVSYEIRSGTPTPERVGMLLRALDGRISDGDNQRHFEQIVRRHARDLVWARNILARANPVYDDAWRMVMSGNGMLLTEEQRAAIAVGTGTQGGFLVPTHLDPTLIITNSGSSNIVRSISRVVTLGQENVWHGVSTAGVTASWDAELAEVSDDTPTFSNPSVPVYGAQAFVQATLDALADTGVADDVLALFGDARDRLEGAAHAVGSGVGQPTGIFTALDANTNVEITSAAAAAIALADIHGVYRQVPVRWRGKGSWLMHPLYSLAIKALGTALSASYSTDITQPVADRLIGRPLVESDDAPTTQTTTALDNELVFGDFSNFVIVDKPGSTMTQYIPMLFNVANNLPDGRVGWYMHWRNGSDSVNDLAFRLLQDKTSA